MAGGLEAVLDAWRAFDLDQQRVTLDQQSLEMTARQQASLESRKALTASTKAFRKLPDEEKVAGLKPLLRQYQEEIDALTRRSRAAEKAFVAFYRDLHPLPDPVPCLRQAVTDVRRIAVLEDLQKELEGEVNATEHQLDKLTNQDSTIRELEDRLLAMEGELEAQVTEAVAEREAVIKAAFDKELDSMKDLEEKFAGRVQQAEEALLAAQRQTDDTQSQLFELQSKYDEVQAAHECEMEVLSAQVDRAQTAMMAAQTELESARMQQSRRTPSGGASTPAATDDALAAATARAVEAETEAARQAVTMLSLTQEVKAWQDTVEKQKAAHSETVGRLQADIFRLQGEVRSKADSLEEARLELAQRPTTEQMAMVNRRLSTLTDTETQLQDTKRKLVAAEERSADQQQLIARLEADLDLSANAQRRPSAPQPLASATHDSQLLAVLSSGDAPLPSASPVLLPSASPFEDGGDKAAMVDILVSQRDRLRARVQELEAKQARHAEELGQAQARAEKVTEDNVQLYERIKFLESYASKAPTAGVSTSEIPETRVTVTQAYKTMYDQRMNPFAAFSRQERRKRYSNLSATDKITLNSAQLFLSNSFARKGLLGYLFAMHCLVFATLYHFVHTSHHC